MDIDVWTLVGMAAKGAMYFGVLGASGTQIYRLLILAAPSGGAARFSAATLAYALAGLLGAVFVFLCSAAMLVGGSEGMTDPEMLHLLWGTSQGAMLQLCLVGLALLIFGSLTKGPARYVALIGALVALSAFLAVGHVADTGSTVARVGHLLHLVGMATWLGALLPLYGLARGGDTIDELAHAAKRFGAFATIFVPIALVAGAGLAWWLLGSAGSLFTTDYGLVLLGKTSAAMVLLALAAWNKLRLTPALQERDTRAVVSFRRSVASEFALILIIVFATAMLTTVVAPA
ncbi:MAG: CopD family protein [Pseudomonadota bacterium]